MRLVYTAVVDGVAIHARLEQLGWRDSPEYTLAELADDGLQPARVGTVSRGHVELLGLGDPLLGSLSGRLLDSAVGALDRPTCGDWVACRLSNGTAVVERVLPRQSYFVRKASGPSAVPQLVAANVNRVLVVTALGMDLSPRRVERYIASVIAGGALPVVVVNKSDLAETVAADLGDLYVAAGEWPCVLTSTTRDDGLNELTPFLEPGDVPFRTRWPPVFCQERAWRVTCNCHKSLNPPRPARKRASRAIPNPAGKPAPKTFDGIRNRSVGNRVLWGIKQKRGRNRPRRARQRQRSPRQSPGPPPNSEMGCRTGEL